MQQVTGEPCGPQSPLGPDKQVGREINHQPRVCLTDHERPRNAVQYSSPNLRCLSSHRNGVSSGGTEDALRVAFLHHARRSAASRLRPG